MTDEQAAALALTGITAHLGLVRDAKLQRARSFSSTGHRRRRFRRDSDRQATRRAGDYDRGSDEKAALARMLGADTVINYKTQDVDAEIKAAAPNGINVFWETQLCPDFDRACR